MKKQYLGIDRKLNKDFLVKLCPISCGTKTKITKETFKQLCKFHRSRIAKHKSIIVSDNLHNGFCKTCKGKSTPNEITFVTTWER